MSRVGFRDLAVSAECILHGRPVRFPHQSERWPYTPFRWCSFEPRSRGVRRANVVFDGIYGIGPTGLVASWHGLPSAPCLVVHEEFLLVFLEFVAVLIELDVVDEREPSAPSRIRFECHRTIIVLAAHAHGAREHNACSRIFPKPLQLWALQSSNRFGVLVNRFFRHGS